MSSSVKNLCKEISLPGLATSNLCPEVVVRRNKGEDIILQMQIRQAELMHDMHRAYSILNGREYDALKVRTYKEHRDLHNKIEKYKDENPEFFL